jgi:hypothetical protein
VALKKRHAMSSLPRKQPSVMPLPIVETECLSQRGSVQNQPVLDGAAQLSVVGAMLWRFQQLSNCETSAVRFIQTLVLVPFFFCRGEMCGCVLQSITPKVAETWTSSRLVLEGIKFSVFLSVSNNVRDGSGRAFFCARPQTTYRQLSCLFVRSRVQRLGIRASQDPRGGEPLNFRNARPFQAVAESDQTFFRHN